MMQAFQIEKITSVSENELTVIGRCLDDIEIGSQVYLLEEGKQLPNEAKAFVVSHIFIYGKDIDLLPGGWTGKLIMTGKEVVVGGNKYSLYH
ncbi:hypothetical protein KTT_18630 [Tengunoibacter tsumagoiensis]|uniref:Uncharacterized protein n=2 Tax=Tengunoibacter tsumagoiensis TaxID=2014871 RepID=A0A401ZYS1_9CHLR|nr:hypothetical protein KTT_18630 [Tengunoibacter tsumagoiensis]